MQTFEGSRFTVCSDSKHEMGFDLYLSDKTGTPLRSFSAFQRAYPDTAKYVRFGMNAGMFDGSGQPIGLFIFNDKVIHPLNTKRGRGNFYMQPNGVFTLKDGAYQIIPTGKFKLSPGIWIATQSGPMLVIDGKLNPAFAADGPSRYVRNGVGLAANGQPVFVISEDPVSFGKFARFFRDRLRVRNALYLDGAVSSLWDPESHRRDRHSALGPLLIALEEQE